MRDTVVDGYLVRVSIGFYLVLSWKNIKISI
jgi:hypothetical protein